MIPPAAARFIATGNPRAALRLIPGEGHYLVLDRWRGILAELVEGERS